MAQALFKSWFVDFDPVIDNALAAGNAIPDELFERAEQRKAIEKKDNSDIQALFPDEFEFTEEMGWIPKGWSISTLDNLTTELRRGISPKYTEVDGVRVVNQRCIRNHSIDYSVCRLNDASIRKVEGRYLEVGDVLVNSTGVGTLGRMAQVSYLDEPAVVDSHVTVVRPNTELVKPYTFGRLMLSIEPLVESMGLGSTGQTELSRVHLGELVVCIPPIELQEFIEKSFSSYSNKSAFNLQQNITLAKLRDTLLPQLMSGELRISDAVDLVEKI
jgi:type I restriction enzyme S subunit